MATLYPTQIDSSISLPEVVDDSTPVSGSIVNNLRSAIIATEAELGIKPSGIYTNVRTRLDVLESALATIASFVGNVIIAGDLVGVTSQTVIGLQGRPLANIAPSTGQVLEWNGGQWVPFTIPLSAGGSDRFVQFNDSGILNGVTGVQIDTSNNLQVSTNFSVLGVAVGATYGGGVGVEFLGNATTNPSTNPTDGIILYADAADNLLKYRQISGTVITLAAAGVSAVIFDGGVTSQNIRSDRSINQSAIDNTKDGIVNLGSATTVAVGATGNYSTIGGGDANEASGNYSTVAGGQINVASGDFSFAAGGGNAATGECAVALGLASNATGLRSVVIGQGCLASGDYAVAIGFQDTASGIKSFAIGDSNTASDIASVAMGESCFAIAEGAFAMGNGCTASGIKSVAIGDNNTASGLASIALGENCTASVEASFSVGSSNSVAAIEGFAIGGGHNVTGRASGAIGLFGITSRYAEFVHSVSAITSYHRVLLSNHSSTGATVNLTFPDSTEITMLDTKSYSIRVTFLASRSDAQGTARESREILAHASGGVLVIDDDTTVVSAPNGQIYSYNVTTDGALILRIQATGDPTQEVDFSAVVEWSELAGF